MQKEKIVFACGPYKLDGQDITEVMIRRPKVRDSLAARKNADSGDYEVTIISNLTGLPVEVLVDMDLYDYGLLQTAYANFTRQPPNKSEPT